MTVGGTRPQPVARETTYVATSRPASVPSGKSHSGRSPATGLWTHMAETPSRVTTQNRVALLASTSWPWTSSSPWVSSRRASSSDSSGCRGSPKLAAGSLPPVTDPVSPSDPPAVAVGPGADVPLGVEGLPTEGARRTPGLDNGHGSLDECAGDRPGDPDAQDVRTVLLVVEVGLLLLGGRAGLDDDPLAVLVPGQRHRPDPELLAKGRVERRGVVQLPRSHRGDWGCPAAAPQDLVEQLLDAFRQHAHLLLLQRDARHAPAGGSLEVEDPLTGLADGAGDEPVGRVELKDLTRHDASLCIHAGSPGRRSLTHRRPRHLRRRRPSRTYVASDQVVAWVAEGRPPSPRRH